MVPTIAASVSPGDVLEMQIPGPYPAPPPPTESETLRVGPQCLSMLPMGLLYPVKLERPGFRRPGLGDLDRSKYSFNSFEYGWKNVNFVLETVFTLI